MGEWYKHLNKRALLKTLGRIFFMIRLAIFIFIFCSSGLLVNAGNKVFSSCDLYRYSQSGSSSDYNEIELAIPSGDIIETTKSDPSFITDLKKDCLLTFCQ